MNQTTVAADSPRNRLASAIDAVRSISAAQIRVTVVLGLCLTAITLAVAWFSIMQIARNGSWWAIVTEFAVGDQMKAFILLIAVVVATRAVDEGYPPRNAYVLATLVGCTAGVVAFQILDRVWSALILTWPAPAGRPWLQANVKRWYMPIFDLTYWLPIGSALVFVYAGRRAALRAEARLRAAELDRIRRSKLALESRLQAMQARVEPQFLFNTLFQIERLYRFDSELAARTLDDLIAYLRAAMPLMRDTSSTVAQEFELARAYLDIVRLRLGERLAVNIETPPGGENIRMPPMMLLPIIDHAILRGFASQNAEGAISIRGAAQGGRLFLTISHSGAAFVPVAGGENLDAIRERLTALYADQGTLRLAGSHSRSTQAVLEIPLERRAASGE